jgi:hypothetical protein
MDQGCGLDVNQLQLQLNNDGEAVRSISTRGHSSRLRDGWVYGWNAMSGRPAGRKRDLYVSPRKRQRTVRALQGPTDG